MQNAHHHQSPGSGRPLRRQSRRAPARVGHPPRKETMPACLRRGCSRWKSSRYPLNPARRSRTRSRSGRLSARARSAPMRGWWPIAPARPRRRGRARRRPAAGRVGGAARGRREVASPSPPASPTAGRRSAGVCRRRAWAGRAAPPAPLRLVADQAGDSPGQGQHFKAVVRPPHPHHSRVGEAGDSAQVFHLPVRVQSVGPRITLRHHRQAVPQAGHDGGEAVAYATAAGNDQRTVTARAGRRRRRAARPPHRGRGRASGRRHRPAGTHSTSR